MPRPLAAGESEAALASPGSGEAPRSNWTSKPTRTRILVGVVIGPRCRCLSLYPHVRCIPLHGEHHRIRMREGASGVALMIDLSRGVGLP
jgi:hypothetical protein